jgi:hypothetical protein
VEDLGMIRKFKIALAQISCEIGNKKENIIRREKKEIAKAYNKGIVVGDKTYPFILNEW